MRRGMTCRKVSVKMAGGSMRGGFLTEFGCDFLRGDFGRSVFSDERFDIEGEGQENES